MERAALLKELGFSDEFIKLVEEDDDTIYMPNVVRDIAIIDPLESIRPDDLTELVIKRTDPPVSPIVSSR